MFFSAFNSSNWHPSQGFVSILSKLNQGVLLLNADRKIKYINPKGVEICKLNSTSINCVEMSFVEFIDAIQQIFADPIHFKQNIIQVMDSMLPILEYEVPMQDGTLLSLDYYPFFDNEVLVGHLYIWTDKTEQVRITKELNDQKAFYEMILKFVPTDLAVYDNQHRYIFMNHAAIKNDAIREWIIGKTDFDYYKLKGLDITLAQNREKIINKVEREKRTIEWEDKLKDDQGNDLFYIRRLSPVFDDKGEVAMSIGYGVNITERRKVEEKLRKSEELYRLVIEATDNGIWDWDLETDYVFFNDRIAQMFGYTPGELPYHISAWHQVMHPEDLKIALELLNDHFNNNVPFSYTLRFFHKDGSIRWIHAKGFAQRDQNGKPYRMVGAYTDVTSSKIYEENLRRSKELAEEAARSKEMFLANMSHEIRTPLNGVMGVLSLLSKTELSNTQQNYLSLIQNSADNLLHVLNDILDMAKIESGKIELERIPFNLVNTVQKAIQPLFYRAHDKNIEIKLSSAATQDVHVYGDPFRIAQIITNLVSNAIKFTNKGKVEIVITQPTEHQKNQYRITVIDTGIGIPKAKIDTIFESFSQVNSDIARKFGGTGLGLAICKNLVDIMNGSISVVSEEGIGTTFTIDLTLEHASSEVINPSVSRVVDWSDLAGIKLLVAEDNEINQFLVDQLLSGWSIEVDVAMNGKEAIERWLEKKYDLILMDVQMPVMDGVEATRFIRNQSHLESSKIPIIALTANALQGDAEKYMSMGMTDYLAKPFSDEELYRKIQKHTIGVSNEATSAPNKANDSVGYNFDYIHKLSGGNKEFEQKLMSVFIRTIPDSIQQLRHGLKSGDYELIRAQAHKLKSTVLAMDIKPITEDIQKLEDAARTQTHLDTIPSLIDKISHILSLVTDEFSKVLRSN